MAIHFISQIFNKRIVIVVKMRFDLLLEGETFTKSASSWLIYYEEDGCPDLHLLFGGWQSHLLRFIQKSNSIFLFGQSRNVEQFFFFFMRRRDKSLLDFFVIFSKLGVSLCVYSKKCWAFPGLPFTYQTIILYLSNL